MRFLFVNELEDSFSGLVLRANRGTGCYRGHRSDSRKWGFNGRVALQKSLAVHVGLGSDSPLGRCRLSVRFARNRTCGGNFEN
jgi:hypothetical protein